jgi:hypothetical protein
MLLGQPICAADVFHIVRGLGACPAMATAMSRAQVRGVVCSTQCKRNDMIDVKCLTDLDLPAA